jgi:hypothetical protein
MHFFPLSGNNCNNASVTDTRSTQASREPAHADTTSYSPVPSLRAAAAHAYADKYSRAALLNLYARDRA